jgi:hypothetical protein
MFCESAFSPLFIGLLVPVEGINSKPLFPGIAHYKNSETIGARQSRQRSIER